jgi:dye decolorizing peroxidase
VTGGIAAGAAGAGIIVNQLAANGGTTQSGGNAQPTPSFYGIHQPGVTDHAPAHLRFVSFDLTGATLRGGRPAIAALQRSLSTAAAAMMAGHWIEQQGGALAGVEPAGLSMTFGFGARLITASGASLPAAMKPLPAFHGDRLDPARSSGDLGVQVCGQNEKVVDSAARALIALATPGAVPRWIQAGFLPADAAANPGQTPRNLMGQLDGTDNPTGARRELAVWVNHAVQPAWMAGGTYLVCRRIRMLLESWERLGVDAKQQVIGRRLDNGAPLSGGTEHSTPSFAAADADGRPMIPANAHLRLTHPAMNGGSTMLRRGFSYDEGLGTDGTQQAGLFFQAFQTDPHQVFVPIQRRLAAADALTAFIRHEASALFAVPPGAPEGGWVGQSLLG